MALKGSSTTREAGDWLNFDELAKERAAIVATLLEVEDWKDYGNGELRAVRLRIIVLTGSQAGTVYPDERVLKAGIRKRFFDDDKKHGPDGKQYAEVGDEIVGRMEMYPGRGNRTHPGLNDEDDGDIELAKKALADYAAGRLGVAATNGTAAKTASKAEAEDDEDPPF